MSANHPITKIEVVASRLLNNSLAARLESCVVASVEGELDFEGAVVLQFGRSFAGDFVSLFAGGVYPAARIHQRRAARLAMPEPNNC